MVGVFFFFLNPHLTGKEAKVQRPTCSGTVRDESNLVSLVNRLPKDRKTREPGSREASGRGAGAGRLSGHSAFTLCPQGVSRCRGRGVPNARRPSCGKAAPPSPIAADLVPGCAAGAWKEILPPPELLGGASPRPVGTGQWSAYPGKAVEAPRGGALLPGQASGCDKPLVDGAAGIDAPPPRAVAASAGITGTQNITGLCLLGQNRPPGGRERPEEP